MGNEAPGSTSAQESQTRKFRAHQLRSVVAFAPLPRIKVAANSPPADFQDVDDPMPTRQCAMPATADVSLDTIVSEPSAVSPSTPVLLLLHFWGGSNRTWTPLIHALAEEYIIIAPSLRGWGKSQSASFTDGATYTTYTITDNTADIVALLEHLSRTHAHFFSSSRELYIVGHSMGAKIAQLMVTQLPTELAAALRGLVLVAPAPSGPVMLPPAMRVQQVQAYGSHRTAEEAFRNVLLGQPDAVNAEVLQWLVEDAVAGADGAKRSWLENGMGLNVEAEVTTAVREWKGCLRVIVIVGGKDRVEPREVVEEKVVTVLRKASAKVELEVLDGVGHLIPVEATDALADRVRTFVNVPRT